MSDVLKVENLCKSYPKFQLKNVSFAIPEGCVAGFIGANGQGKTTTIRSLLGLCEYDSGSISYFNEDFKVNHQTILDEIGVVFDDGYFFDNLTIDEMKEILAGGYTNWDEQVYQGLLKRFELSSKQVISTLSKGMRMKFAIALALSHHAKLLIMDEPTSGLDPLVRTEILEVLKDEMNEGVQGILYSTHVTSDLERFADMIIFINEGQIVFVKDKDELLEEYKVVKGDVNELNDELRSLFLYLEEKSYNFEGVTNQAKTIREFLPNCLIEHASIEQIMLAHIKGERK